MERICLKTGALFLTGTIPGQRNYYICSRQIPDKLKQLKYTGQTKFLVFSF